MGGAQLTVSWTFRWPPILPPVGLVVLLGFEALSPWDGTRIVCWRLLPVLEIITLIPIENYLILFRII
jgi:hypothetical protein